MGKSFRPNKKTEITPIDVKIVSKEEALWTRMRDYVKSQVNSLKDQITFNEAVLVMCDSKILEAKQK